MKRLLLLLLAFAATVSAQDAVATQELVKQDLRSARRELVAMNIRIADKEKAQLFWSMYDDYVLESGKNNDDYVELLKKYAENFEKMDDATANQIVAESFAISSARQKLLKKTHKKISSKVSPVEAARFVQIENRISLMLDLQIAAGLPMLLPDGVGAGQPQKVIEVNVK